MKYQKGERKLLGEDSVARQGKGKEDSARCRLLSKRERSHWT